MLRPQSTLKTPFWLIVCAACFFVGMALQKRLDRPVYVQRTTKPKPGAFYVEAIEIEGVQWFRHVKAEE